VWTGLAWLLAVLWPPLPLTLAFWPSSNTGIMVVRDPRTIAMVLGGVTVATIFWLIDREQKRDGAPQTRLGVLVRFIAYGFVFTVLATAAVVLLLAIVALFSSGDAIRRLGEFKATLVMGVVIMPLLLLIGVSYSVWSGAIASFVAFGPSRPPVRPRSNLVEPLIADEAPKPIMTFAAEPEPPAVPKGPQPETDLEAALRPDLD
jgi:hypothetical protein